MAKLDYVWNQLNSKKDKYIIFFCYFVVLEWASKKSLQEIPKEKVVSKHACIVQEEQC